MKEKLEQWLHQGKNRWQQLTGRQRWMIFGIAAVLLASFILYGIIAANPAYETVYVDIAPAEVGQIKTKLTEMGVPYRISSDGRSISVPKVKAAEVRVTLASEGIPKTGSIDYDIFAKNVSLGMTDKQFGVLERSAMETQLAQLIKSIAGIKDASVMITLPKESVWLSETQGNASASVIVTMEEGAALNGTQINGLYQLISKSVPSLPKENISIVDQYGQPLTPPAEGTGEGSNLTTDYQQQLQVKKAFEAELQHNIRQMLETIMGKGSVVVQVFAQFNFDQVKQVENLVEPVDKQRNEGLPISVQKIQETYQGSGQPPGGVTGTGLTDIPTYQADNGGGNSNYENIQSTINYEVNRIQTDIVKSPYRLEDLNINVGIEPPDPANPASLDAQTQQAIRSMLANIVRTALADKQTVITNQDAMDRVVVIPRQFDGKPTVPNATKPAWWIYALIGLAALAIGGAAGWAIRRRKADEREIIPNDLTIPAIDQPREQSKGDLIKQDLEKLARQRPEDFASLLRTWLVDE